MNNDQFNAFLAEARDVPEHIRRGQHAFNTLYKYDKELANEICGTDNDPFDNDKKINDFLFLVLSKVKDETD